MIPCSCLNKLCVVSMETWCMSKMPVVCRTLPTTFSKSKHRSMWPTETVKCLRIIVWRNVIPMVHIITHTEKDISFTRKNRWWERNDFFFFFVSQLLYVTLHNNMRMFVKMCRITTKIENCNEIVIKSIHLKCFKLLCQTIASAFPNNDKFEECSFFK